LDDYFVVLLTLIKRILITFVLPICHSAVQLESCLVDRKPLNGALGCNRFYSNNKHLKLSRNLEWSIRQGCGMNSIVYWSETDKFSLVVWHKPFYHYGTYNRHPKQYQYERNLSCLTHCPSLFMLEWWQ